jgi:hypothetical protein
LLLDVAEAGLVSKLKDFFSKIDTDVNMDHRVQNKLLYYDIENSQEGRKKHIDRNERRYRKPFRHSLSRLSVLKPMFPSLAVLLFIAVILLGIRANLFSKASVPKDGIEATNQSAGSNNSNYTAESGDENSSADNLGEKTLTQSSDTAPVETSVTEDAVEIVTSGEKDEIYKGKDVDQQEDTTTNVPANTSVTETKKAAAETKEAAIAEKTAEISQSTEKKATEKDFYYAWFDVITEDNVKASIPSLIVRFHGTVDSIDPSDLSDIVLTRDGVPIENSITLTGKVDQNKWGNEDI